MPGGFCLCFCSDNVFVNAPLASHPLQNFICCPRKVTCNLLSQAVCFDVLPHATIPWMQARYLRSSGYLMVCSVVLGSRLEGRISHAGSTFTFAGQRGHRWQSGESSRIGGS